MSYKVFDKNEPQDYYFWPTYDIKMAEVLELLVKLGPAHMVKTSNLNDPLCDFTISQPTFEHLPYRLQRQFQKVKKDQ